MPLEDQRNIVRLWDCCQCFSSSPGQLLCKFCFMIVHNIYVSVFSSIFYNLKRFSFGVPGGSVA